MILNCQLGALAIPFNDSIKDFKVFQQKFVKSMPGEASAKVLAHSFDMIQYPKIGVDQLLVSNTSN
jgi:hypothetical protein